MARRQREDTSGGSGDWLNTYADMVTLLLTFFILLYSMSSLDAAKFNMLVKAFASDSETSDKIVLAGEADGENQGGAVPDLSKVSQNPEFEDISDVFEALQAYVNQNNLQDSVEVSQGEGYVFIRFMDDMLFEPNSARLKTADLEILNFIGYGIKSVQDQAAVIRIDGHTAAIPQNPDYAVSDRQLSSERANNVLMYFEDVIGIDPTKLVQVAFGKQRPFVSNENELDRQKNRRVEILISGEDIMGNELEAIYEKLVE